MIQYSLVCDKDHKFDAWFRNADAYEEQRERGIVTCPICMTPKVEKALMAPSVARSRGSEKMAVSSGHPQHAQLRAAMQALRAKITSEADYVGDKFAEEARKIHFGETEARGIYAMTPNGEATPLADGEVMMAGMLSTAKTTSVSSIRICPSCRFSTGGKERVSPPGRRATAPSTCSSATPAAPTASPSTASCRPSR